MKDIERAGEVGAFMETPAWKERPLEMRASIAIDCVAFGCRSYSACISLRRSRICTCTIHELDVFSTRGANIRTRRSQTLPADTPC